jgi:capsular exopolysaccharide synthesis family protein
MATPNAVIVDPADFNPSPVSPKKNIILLAALLIGLIVPVLVIYIKDLFDNRLRAKDQLLKIVKAPFLGEIPRLDNTKVNKPFPVLNVRSEIAEKFRIVTSNLEFIIPRNKASVIMVTSTRGGEGKSFFSRNLAMSLATSGKQTLLIDFDMRKSLMNELLEMEKKQGIVMYLSDLSLDVTDVIDTSKTFNKNLDIIPVKVFPPNPAELLASQRLDLLFEKVETQYDYIIVDTAPVGLVADAYRIGKFADTTIFVTRSGYTYKADLQEIHFLYKNNKLNNLTTVLNAVPFTKPYVYGYGYYGGKKHNYYAEEE